MKKKGHFMLMMFSLETPFYLYKKKSHFSNDVFDVYTGKITL